MRRDEIVAAFLFPPMSVRRQKPAPSSPDHNGGGDAIQIIFTNENIVLTGLDFGE
jgi:hypothetical protein